MEWRFRASKQGLAVIRESCKKMRWTRDTVANDMPLIEASKILEPSGQWPQEGFHGKLYADGINEGSWRRFLNGRDPIQAKIFVVYCHALKVTWENLIEWSEVNVPIPFISLPSSQSQTSDLLCEEDAPNDSSEFIRDVTIPDGSILDPGQEFVKTWEIRNAGNVPWKDRYLTRIGANHGPALVSSAARERIPNTNPGECVEVSVKLKAPEVATTTTGIWKMTFKDGKLCYPERYTYGLSLIIQVLQ
jgi:hypothetical protein